MVLVQNRHWFEHFDNTVTLDLLTQMTKEFMEIFQQCPSRLKRKIKATENFQVTENVSANQTSTINIIYLLTYM